MESFNSAVYQENVTCLAVDEAHIVLRNGTSTTCVCVCVCFFICLKPSSSLEKQFQQEYEGFLLKIFSASAAVADLGGGGFFGFHGTPLCALG